MSMEEKGKKNHVSRDPQKRLTTSMALAAICLALAAVFLSLGYLLPFTGLFIIIFIPFLASLEAIKGDWKAQLIFLGGAICIAFIDMQEGFFEFLPNVLIGLAFGNAVKKRWISFFSFMILLLASFLINTLMIYPIDFFYKVDMIQAYGAILGLAKEKFEPFFLVFELLLTSTQALICFAIISEEIKKLAKTEAEIKTNEFLFGLILLATDLILFTVGYFIYKPLSYLAIGLLLIQAGGEIGCSFRYDNKKFIVFYSAAFIFSLGLFFFLLSFQDKEIKRLCLLPFGLIFVTLGLFMLKYNSIHPIEKIAGETPKDLNDRS